MDVDKEDKRYYKFSVEINASMIPKKYLRKSHNGISFDPHELEFYFQVLLGTEVHTLQLSRKGNILLIIKARPSDISSITTQLKRIGKFEIKEYSNIIVYEDKDIEPILQKFSGSALEVFKHGTPLRTVRHQSGREFVTADLTPYYLRDISGTKVLIVAQTTINLHEISSSDHHKWFEKPLTAISLLCSLKHNTSSRTPVVKIFGLHADSDSRDSQMEIRLTQPEYNSPSVNNHHPYSNDNNNEHTTGVETRNHIIELLRPIEFWSADSDIGVQYLITKGCQNPSIWHITFVQAFYFHFPNVDIKLEELYATSHILLHYSSEKTVRTTSTFDFAPVGVPAVGPTIGIIGAPKCGKSSLIDSIFRMRDGHSGTNIDSTACLQKHIFSSFKIKEKAKSFTVLDTRGYPFDPSHFRDSELLHRFIYGIAEGSDFTRTNIPEDDFRNALTHVILTVHARDLSRGQIKWTDMNDGIALVAFLYSTVVQKLGYRFQHTTQPGVAMDNVYVLVTHVDMLSSDEITRNIEKTHIKESLKEARIPENKIFFGEKTCTWDEDDLLSHEARVNSFLASVPREEDFQDHMHARNLPLDYFHLSQKFCTRRMEEQGCPHAFTVDTTKTFHRLFNTILG